MKQFYNADDVMELCRVKRSKAYEIIKELNNELKEKGIYTNRGLINAKYLHERLYIDK